MKFMLYPAMLLSTVALAQSPTPQITDAQRADFFKAQSKMVTARASAEAAQTEFQAEVAKLLATCGGPDTLTLNQQNDPVCVAKPVAAKVAPKTPAK